MAKGHFSLFRKTLRLLLGALAALLLIGVF